jgi:DNA-binding response OmpR family regulator
MPEQIAAALQAGARSYLTKPIHLDELLASVRDALGIDQGGADRVHA